MRHANRKSARREKAHATSVISEAFPECGVVWGSHSSYGGHRAPRDRTVSFRLRDSRGKYRSNVVWILRQQLASLTVQDARDPVAQANGKRFRKPR
jgi:hypothetical protein